MPRSKRKITTTKTGMEVSSAHCRRCTLDLAPNKFYTAIDTDLDKNGLFSICKDCISEMFNLIYSAEHSIEKTVLKLCRKLNIKFSQEAIEATKAHIKTLEEKGKTDSPFIGIYLSKIHAVNKTTMRMESGLDLTYSEVTSITINNGNTLDNFNELDIESEVISFWGEGYGTKEYEWLEKTLDEWKRSHKCDNKAEETLLREIVFKQFEIEKARKAQLSTASLIKELQDIMKTANVDPAKASLANSGKAQETFSSFIKMIEENEPASYYSQEDKKLFKDFDNIEYYFEKYVRRPLKNFVVGSRDFNVEGEQEDDDELGENTDIDSVETED
jgi:hypothetical protein